MMYLMGFDTDLDSTSQEGGDGAVARRARLFTRFAQQRLTGEIRAWMCCGESAAELSHQGDS